MEEDVCKDRADPRSLWGPDFHRLPSAALEEAGLEPPLKQAARVQAVVATAVCAALSSSSKASAGVLQPKVLRGRPLRAAATAARSSALCTLRSVPLGKYCRSSPLVFSFVPRCHGLWGSQK